MAARTTNPRYAELAQTQAERRIAEKTDEPFRVAFRDIKLSVWDQPVHETFDDFFESKYTRIDDPHAPNGWRLETNPDWSMSRWVEDRTSEWLPTPSPEAQGHAKLSAQET